MKIGSWLANNIVEICRTCREAIADLGPFLVFWSETRRIAMNLVGRVLPRRTHLAAQSGERWCNDPIKLSGVSESADLRDKTP